MKIRFFCLLILNFNLIKFSFVHPIAAMPIIAEKMGYYKLIKKLRMEVQEHLDTIENKMDHYIQELQSNELTRRASVQMQIYQDIYERYFDQFESCFLRVDHQLVNQGYFYDINYVVESRKIQYISDLKERVSRCIHYMMQANLNDLELTFENDY